MTAIAQLNTALTGRYEVEREIGAGGMATVYLARDLRHHRRVALKLLKPELGAVLGGDRFLSEIRVTANLQHPNLLPLFDSGEVDGLLFYVMPFVEGETLRARLDREKQLPIDEALRIATSIAGALDYAHRNGVIHRDLKPENVLLQDGQPLIADFGIALAVSNAGGQRVTQTGLSLGTPQYMSPEQATGDRNVDGRTDIYSLGAVTYEMLTGEPPHSGTTAQAIIARLMTEEPRALTSTRRAVPEHVDFAVRRALEKLPADRFQSAREFADALTTPTSDTHRTFAARSTPRRGAKRFLVPAVIGVAGLALGMAVATLRRPPERPFPTARFMIDPPPDATPIVVTTSVALSPDGRTIVFSARNRTGIQLYARGVGELTARPIAGTAGAGQPVFSPDGRWIAFASASNRSLSKIELTGGAAVTLAPIRSVDGADWAPDGTILFGGGSGQGLMRVPEAGGEAVELTRVDTTRGARSHVWPVVLPDGKSVVFAIWDGKTKEANRLAVASLDDGAVHPLDVSGIAPLGVVEGHLVYVRADGAVMAAPFDMRRRRVTGGSFPLPDSVHVCATCNGDAAVRLSATGSLIALRGADTERLVILDRNGSERSVSRDDRDVIQPRFSPDGRRVAVSIRGQDSAGNRDIWVYDVETGSPTRLTSGRDNFSPRWTADGKRIVFTAGDHRNPRQVWWQPVDGSAAASRLNEAPMGTQAEVSPDGKSLLFGTGDVGNPVEVRWVPLGGDAKAVTVFARDGSASSPTFSPDGRWVAYSATESGHPEVYVRPFPGPGGRVQVSTNGASAPRWIQGGRRLAYATPAGLEVADVSTSPTFGVVSRSPFFAVEKANFDAARGFDVSPDGQRVVTTRPSGDGMKVFVALNWAQQLRERANK